MIIKLLNEDKIKKLLLEKKDFTTIKIRVFETDLMSVVFFSNYLVYMDDGFISHMSSFKEHISKIVEKGIVFPLKKVEITYENSAKFGDNVIVESQIQKIGKKSMIFQHILLRESDKELLATINCVRLIMVNETKELLDIIEFFTKYIY